MNKQLAKTSTTLDKNMTNTETLEVNNLNITNNFVIPIYKTTDVPSRPQTPTQHTMYVEYNTLTYTFTNYYYVDGAWH